ncbi:DUF2974 domain-containing protein [Bifidobacterium sp. CP2]|uniref:DUF2974 domain-containing protein n=1 Tax=Bifidobacterium sp. CP2 TaxID=2809025 RepID=UPI001BDCFEF3|nr:DUF2974 domain-containing protein [Bifidobacterium sp. CP2]MBT1180734.1 DUF2974 domain-containing protein [Bifidobacterium sp. CP2]
MANVFDYVKRETRQLTDPDAPFNEVDALVFASLAYEDVARISPTLSLADDKAVSFAARLRAFRPRHPWMWVKGLVDEPFPSMTLVEANDALHRGDDVAREPSDDDAQEPESAGTDRRADGAATHDVEMVGLADPEETHAFFRAVAESPRFAATRLGAVVEHVNPGEQTQFAAMTFRLPDGRGWNGRPLASRATGTQDGESRHGWPHRNVDPTRGGTLVIAFRGTDDSLIGWKEDFNMSFQYPVPAQRAASAYLDMVARLWKGDIVLTGHSKGGNLAVYAAMNADEEVRRRIRHVYSLDGPGFPPNVVTSRQYLATQPMVTKIVPSSSIVGQIFETPEPCRVVASDSDGIMQHFTFSWQVEGDHFVAEPDLASSSQLFNESLNAWMRDLTVEQRERAVDALFAVLHANGATTFSEVIAGFPGSIPAMVASMFGLSAQDRRHLLEATAILVKAAMARGPRGPRSGR